MRIEGTRGYSMPEVLAGISKKSDMSCLGGLLPDVDHRDSKGGSWGEEDIEIKRKVITKKLGKTKKDVRKSCH